MTDVSALYHAIMDRHGYMLESEARALACLPEFRLMPILARYSNCRFTCSAQDLDFLMGALDHSLCDYVYLRDLSVHEDELRRRYNEWYSNDRRSRGSLDAPYRRSW
jgi:hypothetical protein